jgi:hypothetical protein
VYIHAWFVDNIKIGLISTFVGAIFSNANSCTFLKGLLLHDVDENLKVIGEAFINQGASVVAGSPRP